MDSGARYTADADTAPRRPVETVGFVGLGKAGSNMADNLIASGYRLAVSEADPERERRFVDSHDGVAVGLDAVAAADVVVTMLPNGDVVREVLLGADGSGGLAARMRPGTIVIDTSSSNPYGTRELGAELVERSITLLDAPVTRPEHDHVNTRRIVFMVGGDDPAAVERVMPVLEAMAEQVFAVGALGNGHATKTLNNFVACAGLVAALDAMMIGQRFGLDVETMLDVFNVGTARNFSTASVVVDEALSRRYSTGFQLRLMVKDMGIASAVTERTGFPTDWPMQLRERLGEALRGLDDPAADHAQALEWWERVNGATLPPLRPGRDLPPLSDDE
jgi:3-hydroxyisobutyrate dehydrogenase-like beta-hydroxyacid dehydrogenase